MYDEHHQLRFFSPNQLQNGTGFVKLPSKGLYEGDLLCSSCESEILSIYENYGKKALKGGDLPINETPIVSNGKDQFNHGISVCTNISYTKYKLMLLSILWRASISKNPFFKEVNLGPVHEETLRKMIWDGNAGKIDDYPIVQMTYRNNKNMTYDFIAEPRHKYVYNEIKGYVFIFSGSVYCFYVDYPKPIPEFIQNTTINPLNQMVVYQLTEEGFNAIFKAHYEL